MRVRRDIGVGAAVGSAQRRKIQISCGKSAFASCSTLRQKCHESDRSEKTEGDKGRRGGNKGWSNHIDLAIDPHYTKVSQ